MGEIHQSGQVFQFPSSCLERGMVENVDSADRDRGGRSGYS